MTTKPNSGTVSVSRDLLERLFSDEHVTRMNARQELRSILAQPADQQGEQVCDQAERLANEVAYYRSTLRNVLKDIRDDLARGGMAPSWSGVAETLSIVLSNDHAPSQTATAKLDEDEEFEKAYQSVIDNGWTNVKHMARQVWQARAKLNTPQ